MFCYMYYKSSKPFVSFGQCTFFITFCIFVLQYYFKIILPKSALFRREAKCAKIKFLNFFLQPERLFMA